MDTESEIKEEGGQVESDKATDETKQPEQPRRLKIRTQIKAGGIVKGMCTSPNYYW